MLLLHSLREPILRQHRFGTVCCVVALLRCRVVALLRCCVVLCCVRILVCLCNLQLVLIVVSVGACWPQVMMEHRRKDFVEMQVETPPRTRTRTCTRRTHLIVIDPPVGVTLSVLTPCPPHPLPYRCVCVCV